MRILNLVQPKAGSCRCGSWLKHWEAFSQQAAGFCMVSGCKGKPAVGSLVQKPRELGKVYIVPLCHDCAARQGEYLEIVDGVALVPADGRGTCELKDTSVQRVRLAGAGAEGCRCGSGLRHWEAFSRQRAGYCMAVGCKGKPEIGARVERIGFPGKAYLVPLCKACAARQGETLEVVSGVRLVPAETQDTCGPARKPAPFKVKLLDSRTRGCDCGSWLNHWAAFSGQRAGYCMASGCVGKPDIGALVQKVDEPGKAYVVPLCRTCADEWGKTLEMAGGVHLVPADTRDTCGKDPALDETFWTTSFA